MVTRSDFSKTITQLFKEHPVVAVCGAGVVALAGVYVVGGIVLSAAISILFMPAWMAAAAAGAGYVGWRYLQWKLKADRR